MISGLSVHVLMKNLVDSSPRGNLTVIRKLEEPVREAEDQHEDQGDHQAAEAGANVANVHLAHIWDFPGGTYKPKP